MQYLKEKLCYEVDVLHADKHEIILQVDTVIFDWVGARHAQSTWASLECLCDILRKTLGMKLET